MKKLMHIGDRAMLERMRKLADIAFELNGFVDRIDPEAVKAAKQPKGVVVLSARESKRTSQDDAFDRHAEAVEGGLGVEDFRADFGSESGGRAFVGIDRENPIAGRDGKAGISLIREIVEIADDDEIGVSARDRFGFVSTGAIDDDDDLVGPIERGQAIGKVAGFVAGNNQRGEARATFIHARPPFESSRPRRGRDNKRRMPPS